MKIAFFWTWDFSRNILKNILKEKNSPEIKLIVSQSDKPTWRKMILTETPVKILAKEKNLKVLQPEKLKNNTEFFEEFYSCCCLLKNNSKRNFRNSKILMYKYPLKFITSL